MATHGNEQPSGPKSGVGLAELGILLQRELTNNQCIEVSEQHAVAWCIGRITACRPGALGHAHADDKYVFCWNDVCWSQDGEEPGQFSVTIRFRSIKTNTIDPEKEVKRDTPNRVVEVPIRS